MRTTAKELKKWLENVNDNSFISINTYKNNHITLPFIADDELVKETVKKHSK